MGKDLRGKELGVGISQLKDGRYTARFTNRKGERKQKYFKKLQECRKWIADAQFNDEHGYINANSDMTVNAWFDYWISEIKSGNIRESTRRTTTERYENAIKPIIGDMIVADVKPLHCQKVLSDMASKNRNGTIGKSRAVMHDLFESAVENGMIAKNPVAKSVKAKSEIDDKEVNVLGVQEQKDFESVLGDGVMDHVFRFALQTGMRSGELCGLKWSDIDFDSGLINLSRTLVNIKGMGLVEQQPKTKNGYRTVPLTEKAKDILQRQKERILNQTRISMQYHDYVFLSKNGTPMWRTNLNTRLYHICKRYDFPHISMHCLRHTFATRCIESGMNPKILQKILGHSTISMTMDLYVHATEEAKIEEMKAVEKSLKVV